jgi:hypothetical protein
MYVERPYSVICAYSRAKGRLYSLKSSRNRLYEHLLSINVDEVHFIFTMADFSRFGQPSIEWLDYTMQHGTPPAPPIGAMSPESMQSLVNQGREQASATQMETEGMSAYISSSAPTDPP